MKRIVLACALLIVAAVPARAFPHLTVTACDTVSTSPLVVRTTFTLDIPGPAGPWCDFLMVGQAATGTQLIDCAGVPAGFTCNKSVGGALGEPGPALDFFQPGRCFATNDHFEGFQFLANRAAPCVFIVFKGPLLLDGSFRVNSLDGSYGIRGCLMKDGPVPAAVTSWGQLKSLYR